MLPRDGEHDAQSDDEERPDKPAFTVERDGFNLNAGVRIEAGDDLGRERLMRYGSRPPLSLGRLGGCRAGAPRIGSSTSVAGGARTG
jgi:hypothetical protein